MKYKARKTYTVEAIQYDGTNGEEIAKFSNAFSYTVGDGVAVYTAAGEVILEKKQWVVKDGLKLMVLNHDTFKAKFKKVKEDQE